MNGHARKRGGTPGAGLRLGLFGLLVLSAPVFAHGGDGSHEKGIHQTEHHVAPMTLQRLLDRHGLGNSSILDAEMEHQGQTWIYKIKVLDANGVVRELRFNALNGDPLPTPHQ